MENKSEHLLVVDDDRGLRDRLSRYLTEQGFRVTAVADGPAMDTFLAKQTPDAVIMDLMLPGEDGLSLARRLRTERDLPIIILSARGEDIDRIIGLEIGADDYLPSHSIRVNSLPESVPCCTAIRLLAVQRKERFIHLAPIAWM